MSEYFRCYSTISDVIQHGLLYYINKDMLMHYNSFMNQAKHKISGEQKTTEGNHFATSGN